MSGAVQIRRRIPKLFRRFGRRYDAADGPHPNDRAELHERPVKPSRRFDAVEAQIDARRLEAGAPGVLIWRAGVRHLAAIALLLGDVCDSLGYETASGEGLVDPAVGDPDAV
jgi:hypothetical protein